LYENEKKKTTKGERDKGESLVLEGKRHGSLKSVLSFQWGGGEIPYRFKERGVLPKEKSILAK